MQRQLDSAYFKCYILSEQKLTPISMEKEISSQFLDTYVLDFLDLPEKYSENDLQKAIIHNFKINWIKNVTKHSILGYMSIGGIIHA